MPQASDSQAYLARFLELHPKYIDLSLERMWQLLDQLSNPETKLPPVIHIAGTNGKGSTLAYLKAMMQAQGLRVHAYTSPHLVHFHERIELDGQPISETELAAIFAEVEEKMPVRQLHFLRPQPRRRFLHLPNMKLIICCLRLAWAGGLTPPM